MFRIIAVITVTMMTVLVPNHGAYAYGAIAIGTGTGTGYGLTVNSHSQTQASNEALQECKQHAKGTGTCSIVATLSKQCGAIAGTAKQVGVLASYFGAVGPKLTTTKQSALAACTKNGAKCQVVDAGCDSPSSR